MSLEGIESRCQRKTQCKGFNAGNGIYRRRRNLTRPIDPRGANRT